MGSQFSNSAIEICPKLECVPSLGSLGDRFTTSQEARRLSGLPLKIASAGHLRASCDVVKRSHRDPKLGTHSGFGPISMVEFEN